MSNWIKCTIGDLGTVVGGATPSTKKSENYENGYIPWITPKDLAGYSGRFISHGERNITEKGLKGRSTQLMPEHTILFSSRAPIGYVAIAENSLCTNQGFKSVIPNNNTDYMFLYYLLKYNKDSIENLGSGTIFKEVSGNVMRNVNVMVPKSKKEQEKIAQILSILDEKINDNLLQQVRLMYKDRFIDMTPFDGAIPNDWHEGTVSEIIELHDSQRIPLSSRERADLAKIYPYYGATSVMDYVDRYLFDGIYLLLGEDGTVVDDKGFPILHFICFSV